MTAGEKKLFELKEYWQMHDDEWLGFKVFLGCMAALVLLYVGFAFGHAIGETEGVKPVPPGFEYHAKHKGCEPLYRGIKLVKCSDCGIVFDPAKAGIAVDWEKLWRWAEDK
jgi:hypothetical protein